MDDFAVSTNGIRIRLTDERWPHISDEHGELAGMRQQVLTTVSAPERILEGGHGEMLAVRQIGTRKWMIVVYRELHDDGFIITAFMTRREGWFSKRHLLWPR